MKVTNWLKSGRSSKKEDDAVVNIRCNPAGCNGFTSWSDYVQISIYSKEKSRFIRLNMTKEEAVFFQNQLNEGMKKFENEVA